MSRASFTVIDNATGEIISAQPYADFRTPQNDAAPRIIVVGPRPHDVHMKPRGTVVQRVTAHIIHDTSPDPMECVTGYRPRID